MSQPHGIKWSDQDLLQIMHLTDVEGLSRKQLAERLGKTTNSIVGVISRINRESDIHTCQCVKSKNKDGGMPPKWWS